MGRDGGGQQNSMGQMGNGMQAEGARRIGFKRLDVFNKALLEKWRWRLLVDRHSIWGRVVRAKYKVPTQFDHVVEDGNCSSWWRDILRTRYQGEKGVLVRSCFEKDLCDGSGTRFWQDR